MTGPSATPPPADRPAQAGHDAGRPPSQTPLTVATWNQNGWRAGQERDRAALLDRHGVHLLCAQELNAARFRALHSALGPSWWAVHSLTCRPAPARFVLGSRDLRSQRPLNRRASSGRRHRRPTGRRRHRTVLAPHPHRPVETPGGRLTVASVHVRPGAVVGAQKLQFVRQLGDWLANGPRPLLLGVDANSPTPDDDGHDSTGATPSARCGGPTHAPASSTPGAPPTARSPRHTSCPAATACASTTVALPRPARARHPAPPLRRPAHRRRPRTRHCNRAAPAHSRRNHEPRPAPTGRGQPGAHHSDLAR